MDIVQNELKEEESNELLFRSFSSLFKNQLNVPDVNEILDTQRQILIKLDLTNKNLVDTNQISAKAFQTTGVSDFQSYISILNSMKQDLDFIFKRIKSIKNKLETKYPEKYSNAFKLVRSTQVNIDDEEGEELESNKSDLKQQTDDLETKTNRTNSNESAISSFLQTARERISSFSGKEIVNNILSSADNLLTTSTNLTTTNSSNLEKSVPVYIEPPTQNDS